jgi:hypothetical protein
VELAIINVTIIIIVVTTAITIIMIIIDHHGFINGQVQSGHVSVTVKSSRATSSHVWSSRV